MSQDLIVILVLAAVAAFIVFRLYSVFGARIGSERPAVPPTTNNAPIPASDAPAFPQSSGPAAANANLPGGVADLQRADPSFDVSMFLTGARGAYEMIVQAFATGDKETLKGLLTPRVYNTYERVIDERQGPGPELVRLKSADIAEAGVQGDLARIAVRFEAEIAEGQTGVRETKERWTFERPVRSQSPIWLLASVAQA